MVSPWEDGAKVKFTDAAVTSMTAMNPGERPLGHDRTSSPYGIYTVRNTGDGLWDVFFEENGERWGVQWLTAIDQGVRSARALLSQGEEILASLVKAERCRTEMNDALFVANTMRSSDEHDSHPLSAPDLAATLRLMYPPLRTDIMHWEDEVAARGNDLTNAKKAFARNYPEHAPQEVEA